MVRAFNTVGPCRSEKHYMIPALGRLPEVPDLVDREGYFVVHAPRQTGKTTAIRAIAEELTASGEYAALAFTCETAQAAGDDYVRVQHDILGQIRRRARAALPAELRPPPWPEATEGNLLGEGLAEWALACPKSLVLFFDEIDALQDAALISVLSQLRAGFNERPEGFPASVALCGMRDLRDYRAASGGDPDRLRSGSPFNIKLKSLRLGDFTADEVAELYAQHTAETGQEFTPAAVERAVELTAGQPWLVNALANEIVVEIGVPAPEPITVEHVELAKERLILARATHLDALAARLIEPRVRRVLEPVLAGATASFASDEDVRYARDLGLVAPTQPLRTANPIYHEVIARVLGDSVAENPIADPRAFVLADGRFDVARLLEEFAAFWIGNGEVLADGIIYHEVAPQLVLMAFLQRVVNGGGHIDREYGVGRGRIDLLIRWPYRDEAGKRAVQREAIELKVRHPGDSDPLAEGLAQLDGYLERLGLDAGVLVVFDRRPEAAPIAARTVFAEAVSPSGRPITVLRA
jgi:hypothetical protein